MLPATTVGADRRFRTLAIRLFGILSLVRAAAAFAVCVYFGYELAVLPPLEPGQLDLERLGAIGSTAMIACGVLQLLGCLFAYACCRRALIAAFVLILLVVVLDVWPTLDGLGEAWFGALPLLGLDAILLVTLGWATGRDGGRGDVEIEDERA